MLYKVYTKDIYLSFTRKCNFACAHCYCKEYLSDKTLPTQQHINTFIKFISNTPQLQTITLIGGEPFICKKQILYFLEEIQRFNLHRKQKIRISVFTNGSFYIDLRQYKYFFDEIVIALAGFGQEHDRTRFYKKNHAGSFETIIANAKKYMQDGISTRFNYVVNPRSIPTLHTSVEKIIKAFFPNTISLSIQFDHFTPWKKHPLKIIYYYFTIFKLNRLYPQQHITPHHLHQVKQTLVCPAGTSFIGVDLYSGSIHSCHENNGSNTDIIGNLSKGISNECLQRNIYKRSIYHHTYKHTPPIFSRFLFQVFGGHICKMRNLHHCQSETCIPLHNLLIFICTKIYTCAISCLAHRNK